MQKLKNIFDGLKHGWRVAVIAASAFVVMSATVNNPPVLRRNVPLDASPNELVTITSTNLFTDDVETVDPVEIVYTVEPGETNQNYSAGIFMLRNNKIPAGGAFTQADVNQGRLTYRAPSVIDFPSDAFRFSVRDADGALARDRTFTNFTFRIVFSNSPPSTVNGQASCPIGASCKGKFLATNAEKLQDLTFRVVEDGKLGYVTNLNRFTGEFTYQAFQPGVTGTDQIKFQVNDGLIDAPSPGIFTVVIENQRPVVLAQKFTGVINGSVSGQVSFSDPDLPSQRMTFKLTRPPVKGQVLLNSVSGSFLYIPDPGRFGTAQFEVTVSDGSLEAAPVFYTVLILTTAQDGDLLLGCQSQTETKGGIYVVNPANGDVSPLYEEKFLSDLSSLEYDPGRREAFVAVNASQKQGFIAAFGIGTNSVRLVKGDDGSLPMPLDVAFDANRQLLVADGPDGALRINADTGAVIEKFALTNTAILGITADAQNNTILLDAVNFEQDDSRILRISAADKSLTVLNSDNRLLDPAGILARPNGHYLVCGRGGLFDFSPADGKITSLIGTNNPLVGFMKEMTLDDDGFLYITDFVTGLLQVNLTTLEIRKIVLDQPLVPLGVTSFTVPTNPSDWRRSYFTAQDLADTNKLATVWGDKADPDGDGAPNLFEYAVGTSPIDPSDARSGVTTALVNGTGGKYFRMTFSYRRNDTSLKYTPQSSADLRTWFGAERFTVVKTEAIGPTMGRITYEYNAPVANSKAVFFRLKVEKTAP